MNPVLTTIARLKARLKSEACADMHRIASGISGVDLAKVPARKGPNPLETPLLRFSLRRRQHLSWQRYICGGSH